MLKNKIDKNKYLIIIYTILFISIVSFLSYLLQDIKIIFISMIIMIFSAIILLKPQIYIYIFVAIYPILPDYFRIFHRPVYIYLIIVLIAVSFYSYTVNKKKHFLLEVEKNKDYSRCIYIYVFIELILYIIHMDFTNAGYFLLQNISIIVILYSFVDNKNKLDKMINIVIIVSGLICILGIIEYVFQFNIFSLIENFSYESLDFGSKEYVRFGKVRIEQSFNHSITYCIYLMFCSALAFYKIQVTKKGKGYYLVILILIIINSLLTMSRAPIMLFIMNLLVMFMFINKHKRSRILIISLLLLIIFVLLSQIIDFKFLGFIENIKQMILALFNNNDASEIASQFGGNLNPFEYRLILYKEVFEFTKNYLLFGLQNGKSLIIYYTSDGFTNPSTSIDNNYLCIIMKHGLIGLTNFMFYYCGNIVYSFNNNKFQKSKMYNFNIAFISTMIFYLLNLLSVAQMAELRIVTMFIVIMMIYNKKSVEFE